MFYFGRRRGFEVSRSPSSASLTMAGNFQDVIGENPAPSTFDYYISPSGNDNAAGTSPATPWAITALNTKHATYAGRRVGVLDGTYDVSGITPFTGSISLGPASGTSSSPTIIESVNPRGAVLNNGYARPALMGRLDNTIEYIQIKGFKFIGCTEFGVYIRRDVGRALGILIEDCWFTEQLRTDDADLTDGVFLQATNDAIVRNCRFDDIVNTVQASSVSAVLLYGTIGTLIDRCTFDDVYAGVHSKYAGGSPRTDDQAVTVRQCYFKENVMACRGFDNKDQTTTPPTSPPYGPFVIENSVFEDNEICLGNDGGFSSASPITVRNNTVYLRSSGAKQGFNLVTRSSGQGEPDVYNNIISIGGSATWTTVRAMWITVNGAGTALTGVIDYNCYEGSTEWSTQTGYGYPYYGGDIGTMTSRTAWQNATGKDQTGRSLFATNPLFTLTGSNADRFQLQATSPCLNAGRVGGLSSGATRNIGAWDGVVTQIGSDH